MRMTPRARLEADTRALALPNGRRVGQPGHAVVENYLRERLREIRLEPFRGESFNLPFAGMDPWENQPQRFLNLAGVVPGKDRTLNPVLIGAHYDSVLDGPCADDNATAVAVTLSAAEHFMRQPPERDIVIALFDSEEPPFFLGQFMGSTRFYEDHCVGKTQFACAIIMDLIGHDTEIPGHAALSGLVPGFKEMLAVMGAESHPALPAIVEEAADATKRVRIIPTLNRYIGDLSDHHAFRLGGEPYLFLSCGWGRYYHHPLDNLDWISFEKVERVLAYVLSLVNAIGAREIRGPAKEGDPAEFEIRMLKKSLGLGFPILTSFLRTGSIQTRSDLERVMNSLVGF